MGNVVYTAQQVVNAPTGGNFMSFGANNINTSNVTRYLLPPCFSGASRGTIINTDYGLTDTSTAEFITVNHDEVGVGGAITYTLLKNGSPTDLAVTLNASDVSASFSGGTDTFTFGDRLAIEVTKVALTDDPNGISVSIGFSQI